MATLAVCIGVYRPNGSPALQGYHKAGRRQGGVEQGRICACLGSVDACAVAAVRLSYPLPGRKRSRATHGGTRSARPTLLGSITMGVLQISTVCTLLVTGMGIALLGSVKVPLGPKARNRRGPSGGSDLDLRTGHDPGDAGHRIPDRSDQQTGRAGRRSAPDGRRPDSPGPGEEVRPGAAGGPALERCLVRADQRGQRHPVQGVRGRARPT